MEPLREPMMSMQPNRGSILGQLIRLSRRKPLLSGTLLRAGDIEVRLAERKREIRKAQRLRFKVFYEEGDAIADRTATLIRRDVCPFDKLCDHLLVVDHAARNRFGKRKPRIVGTYRLLRQDVAEQHGGFYSAREFDVAPLLASHRDKRFLELGRSCVARSHRSRHTLDLLWRGIATYVRHYGIDVMIGCASFPGTDPALFASDLRFLMQAHGAPPEWQARARRGRAAQRDPSVSLPADNRHALKTLPPLIKGYLRCGAWFGDEVAIDEQFGTTDVFVVMPVARIASRYLAHFDRVEDSVAA